MTVAQLIELLKAQDQTLEVRYLCPDGYEDWVGPEFHIIQDDGQKVLQFLSYPFVLKDA